MKFIKEKVNKTFKLLFYSEKKWYFSCLLEQYHHYSVLLLFIIVITLKELCHEIQPIRKLQNAR